MHLCLVLTLGPDVDGCITPHPKRKICENPHHYNQQRELFDDVDIVGFDATLGIIPIQRQLFICCRPSVYIKCAEKEFLTGEQDAHGMGNVHRVSKTFYSIKCGLHFLWGGRDK